MKLIFILFFLFISNIILYSQVSIKIDSLMINDCNVLPENENRINEAIGNGPALGFYVKIINNYSKSIKIYKDSLSFELEYIYNDSIINYFSKNIAYNFETNSKFIKIKPKGNYYISFSYEFLYSPVWKGYSNLDYRDELLKILPTILIRIYIGSNKYMSTSRVFFVKITNI